LKNENIYFCKGVKNVIRWLVDSINNTSYNEQGEISFTNEIEFIKKKAPYIIVGTGVVLARGFKWSRKLFKVVTFGVNYAITKEQVPSHKQEEPKRLPPPKPL
jgi:hypothetical protein